MTEHRLESQDYVDEEAEKSSGMNVDDILFIVFRHKWKILVCAAAGIISAAAVYFFHPMEYQSEAKLLLRYVIDRSTIDSTDSGAKSPGGYQDTLMGAEIQILTSLDLAAEVADAVGIKPPPPEPGQLAPPASAAGVVSSGLTVMSEPGSNVLSVSYKSRDPQFSVRVLNELVQRYFVKHLELHRSTAAFDFVSEQTQRVRARMKEAEVELKKLLDSAGIVSLAESTSILQVRTARCQQELDSAEAELAEQRARLGEIGKWLSVDDATQPTPTGPQPTDEDIQEYRILFERMAYLRKAQVDLLARYAPGNELVALNKAQIESLSKQRRKLEARFPGLIATAPIGDSAEGGRSDLLNERVRLAAILAKIAALKTQLAEIQSVSRRLADISAQIKELERTQSIEETNYRNFQASLEKARIDEALDPSKIPNISIVQKPSPAAPADTKKLNKTLIGLAGGGLGLGLALAFLIELVLDRSVKRPLELSTRLKIPLMLWIPDIARNGHLRLRAPQNGGGETTEPERSLVARAEGNDKAPWELGHFIRPFCEAVRDRLILSFQLKKLTHKPKLVGVTGCSKGAGTSTLAGGLAAALSETGDGKVLLVDMHAGGAEVRPFFKGSHAHSLLEALKGGDTIPSAADNLYLATATNSDNGSSKRLIPKRLYDLMPRLRASDFDYIIFDMPPLGPTSATVAMAGFMDKMLLVVEAEVSNRDAVKRAYDELVDARADVSAVFNKARSYGPKSLAGELS